MNTPKKPNRPQSDDELFDPRAFDDEAADIDVPVYRREASEKKTSEVAGEAARDTSRGPQDKSEREERGSLAERLRSRRTGASNTSGATDSPRTRRSNPGGGAEVTDEAGRDERATQSPRLTAGTAAGVTAHAGTAPSSDAKKVCTPGKAARESGAPASVAKESGDSGAEDRPRKKRDIYEVLGRARPQRIQAAPPARATRDSQEPDGATRQSTSAGVAGASTAAGVAGAAGAKAAGAAPQAPAGTDSAFEQASAAGGAARTPSKPVPDSSAAQSASASANAATVPGTAGTAGTARAAGAAGASAAAKKTSAPAQTAAPSIPSSAQSPRSQDSLAGVADGQRNGEHGSRLDVQDGETQQAQDREQPTETEAREQPKRGTLSLGLLLIRLVVGGLLLVRGLQTLFAFGGDPGLDALQQQWSDYNGAQILAVAVPAAEVIAGGLLILGLVTPFAAALAATVAGFLTLHEVNSYQGSLWPYGLSPYIQMWVLMGAGAMSLIFAGPGSISLDRNRAWNTRPLVSAWIFAIVAVAATVVLWLAIGGGNPFN